METNISSPPFSRPSSEKICPNCKKWTIWAMQAQDVCQHCGQLLSTHLQEKEERAEKMKSTPLGMFAILESDNSIIRVGKYTANVGYAIFTAFMSFVVWMVTVIAG